LVLHPRTRILDALWVRDLADPSNVYLRARSTRTSAGMGRRGVGRRAWAVNSM
jgi:hypothetical protein